MKKVFLIDDDDIYVFLTKKTIAKVAPEVAVVVFNNGSDALTYLRGAKDRDELLPDLIFLDLNMPVMDGWEFLEAYQDLYLSLARKNQLYIVSSSISPHEIERSKHISCVNDFLIKPLNKDKFFEILQNL